MVRESTKQLFTIPAYLLLVFLMPLISQASAGIVLDAYKYAWSDHSGYVNFENTVVGDTALSGFAWSANHGWIKLNPTTGGVFNDGEGNLSGYAWGEQLGWIDFSGVSIDESGRFLGQATGDLIGTLTFDCSYCDVRTDWQMPQVEGATTHSSSGVRLNTVDEPVASPPERPTETSEAPAVVHDVVVGPVTISMSNDSYFNSITFDVVLTDALQIPAPNGVALSFVGGFFDVTAHDSYGNLVTFFPRPIRITLPLLSGFYGTQELGVYWFNEKNAKWVLIPDAVFAEDSVSFMVNHLTRFAIIALGEGDGRTELPRDIETTKQTQPLFEYTLLGLIAVIVAGVVIRKASQKGR